MKQLVLIRDKYKMLLTLHSSMLPKTICLFNHKGGVSKTTTAFNLGWSLSNMGKKVLLVDLDSQCNLTGLVLGFNAIDDDNMAGFYNSKSNLTMQDIVSVIINGTQTPDAFVDAHANELLETKHPNLFLLPGHLDVSDLDAQINVAMKVASGLPVMRNTPGNLPAILQKIAVNNNFDYVIYDLSPNVGGLNEIILMSSDYFIVPTSPDYFCLQAIGSLKKNIVKWHTEIARFKHDNKFDNPSYAIKNSPQFLGTIQQRYRPRNEQPGKSFQKWIDRIRAEINGNLVPALEALNCTVSKEKIQSVLKGSSFEPYDLIHIADFNSLIAISQQLSKPVFDLTNEEIALHGNVFAKAKDTMCLSRDNFSKVFIDLANRVVKLTE